MGHLTIAHRNYLSKIAREFPSKRIESALRRFERSVNRLKSVEQVQSDSTESISTASTAPTDADQQSEIEIVFERSEEARREVVAPRIGQDFVKRLNKFLIGWIEQASANPDSQPQLSLFHCVEAPSFTAHAYIERLCKYFLCSEECFVLALVYIDRISKKDPSLNVSALTLHRLMLTATLIAVKAHDDVYYPNTYYAKVGGLRVQELNAMEASMLRVLDWNIFVPVEEYQLYHGLIRSKPCHHISL
jgi:hypothetical protein